MHLYVKLSIHFSTKWNQNQSKFDEPSIVYLEFECSKTHAFVQPEGIVRYKVCSYMATNLLILQTNKVSSDW